MRRGIIRIVAGIIMLLFQVLSIIGHYSWNSYATSNTGYGISFFYGILGIVLLVFGIHAYNSGSRLQLILHKNDSKLCFVAKWIFIMITIVCFLFCWLSLKHYIDVFAFLYTVFMMLGTLSFAVYLIFYIYKKPSCLFSTTLIFVGMAYLFAVFGNVFVYIIYYIEMEKGLIFVILSIIPQLIAGILYVVVATKIYKEVFSTKGVIVLGRIVLCMEIIYRIIDEIIIYKIFTFYNLGEIMWLLFVVGLFLYISVFRINSIQETLINDDRCS